MPKVQSDEKTLKKIIRTDDASALISLLEAEKDGHVLSYSELLKSICIHRAEDCFCALIDRRRDDIDLNVPYEDGLFPLNLAAQSLSRVLTQFLISNGADPNSPCDDPQILPLNSALSALRDHEFVKDWNPKKSIIKLFYIFCLPELEEPLRTVRLLASETNNLEMMGLRCVVQGEIVQLAALLSVAWPELMDSYAEQGVSGCPIGKLIINEYKQLENYIAMFPNSAVAFKERKATLEIQWMVLHFLDRARDTIEDYQQFDLGPELMAYEVPFHVGTRLHRVKRIYLELEDVYSDDVKCLTPALKPKHKAWLFQAINKELCSAPSTLLKHSIAGSVSGSRSFHTCQARNFNLVKPARSPLSRTTHTFVPFIPKLIRSIDIAPLMAIFKRSVKRL